MESQQTKHSQNKPDLNLMKKTQIYLALLKTFQEKKKQDTKVPSKEENTGYHNFTE